MIYIPCHDEQEMLPARRCEQQSSEELQSESSALRPLSLPSAELYHRASQLYAITTSKVFEEIATSLPVASLHMSRALLLRPLCCFPGAALQPESPRRRQRVMWPVWTIPWLTKSVAAGHSDAGFPAYTVLSVAAVSLRLLPHWGQAGTREARTITFEVAQPATVWARATVEGGADVHLPST